MNNLSVFAVVCFLIFLATLCAFAIYQLTMRKTVLSLGVYIRKHLLATVAILVTGLLAVFITHSWYEYKGKVQTIRERIYKSKEAQIISMVNHAMADISFDRQMLAQMGASEEEIKEHVKRRVETYSFADGEGYVFVKNYNGIELVNRTQPNLIGVNLHELTDPDGVKVVQELIKVAKNPEGGFVSYKWEKPGTSSKVEKLSYAKGIQDWGWVVGTGLYLDGVVQAVAEARKEVKTTMLFKTGLIISFGLTVLFGMMIVVRRFLSRIDKELKLVSSGIAANDTDYQEIKASDLRVVEFRHIAKKASETFNRLRMARTMLNESEKKFRQIAETMADGIWEADTNGKYTFCSPQLARILEHDPAEIIGKSPLEFVAPDDFAKAERNYRQILDKREPFKDYENWNITATGKRVYLQSSGSPFYDTTGNLLGYRGVKRDLTNHKRSQDAIRAAHGRMKAITNAAQDSIIMIDPKGDISFWNPAAEKMFGYTAEDAIGRNLHKLVVPERYHKLHYATFAQFNKSGKGGAVGKTMELYALHKDGMEFPVELSLSALKLNDGWHAVGLMRDITERKRSEQTLQRSKKELERINHHLELQTARANDMAAQAEMANSYKSQFLANMSHEIRTPMNAIIGFSEVLADEQLTKAQKLHVSIIRESAANLLTIINDILDYSKMEAGKLKIEKKNFDLHTLLSSVESMMHASATEKHIAFQIIEQSQIPGQILTDPARLNQCLINLVNNAIKFTEVGHVHLKVKSYAEKGQNFISFSVEDTGIGISRKRLDSIFESFTQEDGSTTRKYGGTGLGLTITKQLIELLGGKITVESEKGKGSIFTMTIPVEIVNDEISDVAVIESRNEQIQQDCSLQGRVLVAEDVKTNQMLIERLLRQMGLDITIVGDGKQAVEKAQKNSYDLILLDIQMPYMNGYKAAAAIKRTGMDVPLVALTANAMSGDREKCLKKGFDDYLAKPINRSELNQVLAKFLISQPSAKPENQTSNAIHFGGDADGLINWQELISRAGDANQAALLLNIWSQEMTKAVAKLRDAIANARAEDIASTAHLIKGSSANIAAEAVRKRAAQLELAAESAGRAELENFADEIEAQVAAICWQHSEAMAI